MQPASGPEVVRLSWPGRVASVPGKEPLGPLFVVSGGGSQLNQE